MWLAAALALRVSGLYFSRMTTAELIEEIRQRAQQLPQAERRAIALELLDGLDDSDKWEPSHAFVDEIDRRCAEIDRGEVKMLSLEEVDARVRARFGW